MFNKRVLIFCFILTVSAAVLQIIPYMFEAAFIFSDILSGFTIYFSARLNWILGVFIYLAAAALSSSINTGEALFFICTNGIIGLSLGIIKTRFEKIYLMPVPSALIVIVMLFGVNYLIGISIFGYPAFKAPILQGLALFLPLYIYCFIFLKLAMSADNLLQRHIDFRIY